jgi:hypothetical protein
VEVRILPLQHSKALVRHKRTGAFSFGAWRPKLAKAEKEKDRGTAQQAQGLLLAPHQGSANGQSSNFDCLRGKRKKPKDPQITKSDTDFGPVLHPIAN